MPRQSFRHASHTKATVAQVWARLQDAAVWGSIAGADRVSDERHSPDGELTHFSFVATVAGRPHRGTASVQGNGLNHMATFIETTDLGGVITVDLEPSEHSTVIHVQLDVHSRSFLAGIAFGAIAAAISGGFPERVEALAGTVADRGPGD